MKRSDSKIITWDDIQAKYADIPGEAGIIARKEAYQPFFLKMAESVRIEEGCRFYHPDQIALDDDVRINIGALIYGSGGIRIGRHARLGPRCFIHSANHEIYPEEEAFFESGYIYESVEIGDNCLISANVSLLPGVRLGVGCFVACGATVTRGTYEENSRLVGLPAKARNRLEVFDCEETPSVALLVDKNGYYRDAAKLLVTSLGLPQVRVVEENENIPSSIKQIIAFGPEEWELPVTDIPVWRFSAPNTCLSGEVKAYQTGYHGSNSASSLPGTVKHMISPTPRTDLSTQENVATMTLYYTIKRIGKETGLPQTNERLEWQILKSIAADFPNELIWHVINNGVGVERYRELTDLPGQSNLRKLWTRRKNTQTLNSDKLIVVKESLKDRNAIVNLAERSIDITRRERIQSVLRELAEETSITAKLSLVGIVAYLLGLEDLVNRVEAKLFSSSYLDMQSMCLRSSPNGRGFCYSPGLAAFMLICALRENPNYVPELYKEISTEFDWQVFEGESNFEWILESGSRSGTLVDTQRRRISCSLLENWLSALEVPVLPNEQNGQYEISFNNYATHVAVLDSIWFSFFRLLFRSHNEPLLRLKPFPHGYRAALSLRYDVDRTTQASHLEKIMNIQTRYLNSACATWFVIPDSEFDDKRKTLLSRYVQEAGIHALISKGDFKDQGVTFHSAPGAEYWRGMYTIENLEIGNAAYGEMLGIQLGYPRPVWLNTGSEKRRTGVWLLPLHFPLEGTTKDVSLDYFDKLLPQFRALLNNGGHLIVSSHPDLNQNILIDLVERENFEAVWFAPIGDVVVRSKCILDYGNICVSKLSETDDIRLISRHSVADLQVEVYYPNEEHPETKCLQLTSGKARSLGKRNASND